MDRLASSELAAALEWLPLACLLLAADGSALAVSREWSALFGDSAEGSLADGWASGVDPLDRGILRARLRDAALAGQVGQTHARLAGGPPERWSRWWWRPVPSDRLIVCVADSADFQNHGPWQRDNRRPPARLVRGSELVNLAGRALRRSRHHGGHVAVISVRPDGIAADGSGAGPAGDLLRDSAELVSSAAGPDGVVAEVAPGEFVILLDGLRTPGDGEIIASEVRDAVSWPPVADGAPTRPGSVIGIAITDGEGLSPEELIEKASSARRRASRAVEAVPEPAPDLAGQPWPTVAWTLIDRLYHVGLAVDRAYVLAGCPAITGFQDAMDQLNDIIKDIQAASFASQLAHQRRVGDS